MALPPVITDTNLLLQASAALARGEGKYGTFEAIKMRCFIPKSVDDETTERSRSRARSRFNVDPDAMQRAWLHEIRPYLRVVPISGDDLSHEAIDQVRARNADQADVDIAALAVLLSPCMVITGDDDLRAVARPNLPSDVARSVRHAEPTHHEIARYRLPLVAQHALVQGSTVGAHITVDMVSQAVQHLRRTPTGRAVLAIGAGVVVGAVAHPGVRAKVGKVVSTLSDIAGQHSLATIAAERDCSVRMFPACEPQSLQHRIAQQITHQSLWLSTETIASSINEDHDRVLQACAHPWFSAGVFGSVKVGTKYPAPAEIEGTSIELAGETQ